MLLELDHDFFSHFITPNPELSYWYEDLEDRRTLLVTIGDSWTWGNSLQTSDHSHNWSGFNRVNSVYGRHLQNFIGDSDWINIACPATANGWIVDVAKRFISIADMIDHDRIIISIGLTDMSRDHFQKGFHPLSDGSFLMSLEMYERDYFAQIRAIDHKKITTVLGRNFTSSFDNNQNSMPNHLPKRWIDISRDHWPNGFDPPSCFGMKFPEKFENINEQIWATEVGIPASLRVTDFLMGCPWHYKKATKHPNEQAHLFWAQYVYQYLAEIAVVS